MGMSFLKPVVTVFALFLATAPFSTAQEPAPATDPQTSTEVPEQIQALRDLSTSFSDLAKELRARDHSDLETANNVAAALDRIAKASEKVATASRPREEPNVWKVLTFVLGSLGVVISGITFIATYKVGKNTEKRLEKENEQNRRLIKTLSDKRIAAADTRQKLEMEFLEGREDDERKRLKLATNPTVRLTLDVMATRNKFFKTRVDKLYFDYFDELKTLEYKEIIGPEMAGVDKHLLENLHRHLNVMTPEIGNLVVIALYSYQTLTDYRDFAKRLLAEESTDERTWFDSPDRLLGNLRTMAGNVETSINNATSKISDELKEKLQE